MRFYNIIVTNPKKPSSPYRQWSAQVSGAVAPGALNVELDITLGAFAHAAGDVGGSITVWGVALPDIAQAANFNGMLIQVYAGMQKGLPLANPAQQGLLLSGTIYQALANWQGTDMNLHFVVKSLATSAANPANIVFDWKAGTPLAQAIKTTLAAAYPSYTQQINISPNLVLAHDEASYHYTMTEFAQMLEGITVSLLGATYTGVQVVLRQNTFIVYDSSGQTNPITLAFTDLIGQPTYYAAYQASITAVMRGDIQVGNYIKLPAGFVAGPGTIQTAPSDPSQLLNVSSFQGTFQVTAIRHVGNFRDPDGRSWVTVMNCAFGSAATP